MSSTANSSAVRINRTTGIALLVALALATGCATLAANRRAGRDLRDRPGRSVHETLSRGIALLEASQCVTFAVNFLSPIKLSQVKDMAAYRKQRECSPSDRGNLDEVLMAMRMALGAEPVVQGVKATIDLSGIGLRITKLEFVRYIDGLWYFNEL